MNKLTTANARAAISSRRVREELGTAAQRAVRARVAHEMNYGEHWTWIQGEEYYTAAGLRFLADAHNRESDAAAALVCRRLADDLDAEEARESAAAAEPHRVPSLPDYFTEMERRRLA